MIDRVSFRPPRAPWEPLDSGLMGRSLLSFFLKGCKKKMTKDDDGLQTVLKGHLVLQGAPSGGWH